MKKYFLYLVIFIILFTACTPQSVTIPSPTPVSTNTPFATATPQPTQTMLPIATNTPVAGIPLDSCPHMVEAKISNTGSLEILYDYKSYRLGGGDGPLTPGLYLQYNNLMLNNPFWLWSEDTQKTVSFPLPSDAAGPEISTDYHWILFRRDFGEMKMELWVIDTNGQNEKKLATVSFDEVKVRNPDIGYATLEYGWVPHTDSIYYKVKVQSAGEEDSYSPPTYDAIMLVDIYSGKAIQLAQPGKDPYIVFAPDGLQAAILITSEPVQTDAENYGSQPAVLSNGGELHLVNTNDGNVQFTLPIQIKDNFLAYSPDGKYLIGLSYDGIVSINVEDGSWQKIPLNYTIASDALPKFTWVGNSTILVAITNLPNPDANFTIWRANLTEATTQPIQTFSGDTTSIEFSSDGNYLTFHKAEKQAQSPNGKYAAFQKLGVRLGRGTPKPQKLFLADLNTGSILTTIEVIGFYGWSPYSSRYIYSELGEPVNGVYIGQFYLGQIGKEPIPLGSIEESSPLFYSLRWIWINAERVVIDVGCEIRLISFGPPAKTTVIP